MSNKSDLNPDRHFDHKTLILELRGFTECISKELSRIEDAVEIYKDFDYFDNNDKDSCKNVEKMQGYYHLLKLLLSRIDEIAHRFELEKK